MFPLLLRVWEPAAAVSAMSILALAYRSPELVMSEPTRRVRLARSAVTVPALTNPAPAVIFTFPCVDCTPCPAPLAVLKVPALAIKSTLPVARTAAVDKAILPVVLMPN